MRKIKISADEFAAKVNEAYSGRITIVKETYIGTRNPVTAYCNIHKIYFEVKEARNLTCIRHTNCPKCIEERRKEINKQKIKPWAEILKLFKEKYGDKFSYDESSYIDTKHKIKIHCNDCGADFELDFQHHMRDNNGGCPNCNKTRIGKCSKCGKEIIVDRHTDTNKTTCYCDECRKRRKSIKEEFIELNQIIAKYVVNY